MVEKQSRILYMLKLLYENTDESNPLSTNQIIDSLAEIGISAHRKTVAADIKLLEEYGIDVITIKSTQNKYFIGSRKFEIPEIKLLVDAVESSKFITPQKSEGLIKKLSELVSKFQAQELKNHIFIGKRVKPENEEIYYIVDAINSAINDKKQINFLYYEYNQNKEKVYKNDRYVYKLSPYALSWSEDHYYVIGFCEKHGKISTFRVDRMAKVNISYQEAKLMPEGFNGAEYARSIFEMYDGETKTVELKCANEFMKIIIDRFGEDVNTEILNDDYFKAIVDVSVSPTFYGWVFQFGGKMSIVSPDEVKTEFLNLVEEVLKNN